MFHQHGLPKPLAELVGEQAADEVRTAARRRAGHDPERARGPLFSVGGDRHRRGQRDGEEAREHSHGRIIVLRRPA